MWYSISWLVYEVLALQLTSRLNSAVLGLLEVGKDEVPVGH